MARSLEDALENYIPEPNTGCWLWLGATARGYGIIRRKGGLLRERVATRVVWASIHGPIAAWHQVCHKCDTRACINPAHLFVGTKMVNYLDMLAKNRQAKGSQFGHSVLTEDKVREMRAWYRACLGKPDFRAMGERFGCAAMTAYLASSGRRWKHVA